jgi:hypothetical protein
MNTTARTATEMVIAVGQMVQFRANDLWIDATVLDVKNSWGRNRLLLAPVAGDGTAWFELSSVRPVANPAKLRWDMVPA